MRHGSETPSASAPPIPQRPGRDDATRQRILDAAIRLFSERGFHHVTVRELSREARVNLAAVNYHFGGKLELYEEVVEGVLGLVENDPITDPPEGASPEERIRHYVRTYVPRLAAPRGPGIWFQKLMRHEIDQPTPVAPRIAEEIILPRVRFLATAVAEILRTEPTDPRVRRCVASIQSQCLSLMPNNFRKVALSEHADVSDEDIAAWVRHIVEFSLAGIRSVADTEP